MRDTVHRGLRYASAFLLMVMLITLAVSPAAGASERAYSYDGPLENVVLEWNLYATDALVSGPAAATPGTGQTPPVAALHLAMAQGAVYDAVNMIAGGYQPYLSGLPQAPQSASKAAAVATAAHDVLVGILAVVPTNQTLTPTIVAGIVTRLDGQRDATLAAALAADGAASTTAGAAAGKAAAAAMLAKRANDGRYGPFRFTSGDGLGQWRPQANGSDPNAWVAKTDPFVMTSVSQFRTKGPNALTSEAYAADYNEVKALGSTTSVRDPRQQALAEFFTNTSHPTWMINRAFRQIAINQRLTLVEQARLFAMLNLAGADSAIGCWDDKAHWSFWRPMTAIQEGEKDGNPLTAGDPAWAPFAANPPYPEHASGYNCLAGAYMTVARAYFGKDEMSFSLVKIEAGIPDVTRTYQRFSDVYKDTIDARVYQGHHFRTSDIQGEMLGQQVAEWLASRYFQPVKTPAPPPTGTGGNLPGLPSTGGGGGDRQVNGWLVLATSCALIGGGWLLRRNRQRA